MENSPVAHNLDLVNLTLWLMGRATQWRVSIELIVMRRTIHTDICPIRQCIANLGC